MQNISFRVPSIHTYESYDATGALIQRVNSQTSARHIIRTQSGYNGVFPSTRPLPNHDYTLVCQDYGISQTALYTYTSGYVRKEIAGGPGLGNLIKGVTLFPEPDWSLLEAQALEKLSSSVRGDLDLSVDLAEAGKTVKMLKMTDQVTSIAKTMVNRRLGALKGLGSLLLLHTYGAKPLMQSIFGLAEENLAKVRNAVQHHRVRATGAFRPTQIQVPLNGYDYVFPVIGSGSMKYSITIGVDMTPAEWDGARFSSLNPVSIAWELLPLSFVADWFLNVGGYLRQMETALLYARNFNSGYRSKILAGTVDFGSYRKSSSPQGTVDDRWFGSATLFSQTRRVLSGYPAPRFPSFKASLGSSQMLSAAALLSQVISSGNSTPIQRIARVRQKAIQERARSYNAKPSDRQGVLPPSDWGV
jgi:hypothetical protein